MKIKSLVATNFGSYKKIDFNFGNLGLCLVHGQTGSGKSTIMDAVCWLMYGITAKNGNADEVISWQNPNEPTEGHITTETNNGEITIYRVRSRKKSQNDLWWTEGASPEKKRGKDILETQSLIEIQLMVGAGVYLNGAYFCDSTPSTSFFISRAKDKREVLEKIARLDFPIVLQEKISNAKRKIKEKMARDNTILFGGASRVSTLNSSREDIKARRNDWALKRSITRDDILQKIKESNGEIDKQRDSTTEELQTLKRMVVSDDIFKNKLNKMNLKMKPSISRERCPTCGATKEVQKRFNLQEKIIAINEERAKNMSLISKINNLQKELDILSTSSETYAQQLKDLEQQVNPFIDQEERLNKEIQAAEEEIDKLNADIAAQKAELSSLEHLDDLCSELKGTLLNNAVSDLETQTNHYLEKYFDSEFRVRFSLDGSDDLTVTINKGGYECTYRQLSKGQRRLLTLCFGISVMKATANRAGVHFDNLFFDEPTDGCSSELKLKSYNLFCDLATEHESVTVIEHSEELKSMFSNSYKVSLEGDYSEIERQS